MKKALHIIGKLKIGGAETVAMNIYRHIDRHNFEFHYLVFGDSIDEYEEEVKLLGGKVLHIPRPRKGHLNFYQNLNYIMSSYGPYDIVHSHTLFNSGIAMHAAKKNHIKIRVTHSHSIQNSVTSSFARKIYEAIMRKVINRNATHLIACSKAAGHFLYGRKAFDNRGLMLNNGVDVEKFRYNEFFREEIRNNLKIIDRFVIGHVGHLIAVKNQMFLLEVFRHIYKKNKMAILLLVGDGSDREKLESAAARYGLKNSVIFTGNVNAVYKYLNAMDIFVFPSLYEGLPLAVVEAQANGLPCIISDAVPSDVQLTDIVEPFSLKKTPIEWAEIICEKRRKNSAEYAEKLKGVGFDVRASMNLINEIYDASK